jgi:hypothetical protein
VRSVRFNGPLRIRPTVRSRRDRVGHPHGIHEPSIESLRPLPEAQRVKRMLRVLRKRGWTIEFKVLAVSSTGFRYEAVAVTADKAFLQALGLWRNEAATLVAKVRVEAAERVFHRKYYSVQRAKRAALKEPTDYAKELMRALPRDIPVAA